jgi:hypothetical protein
MPEFDPNLMLQALLGRANIDQQRARLAQEAAAERAKLELEAEEADVNKKLVDAQVKKFEFDTAQAERREADINTALIPESSLDTTQARGRVALGSADPRNAALGIGLGTGAIDMNEFADVLSGERLTMPQLVDTLLKERELTGTEQRTGDLRHLGDRGLDIQENIGTAQLFLGGAQHNLDVMRFKQQTSVTNATLMGTMLDAFPALATGAAQGRYAGVDNPWDLMQLGLSDPNLQGTDFNDFSKTVFERGLSLQLARTEDLKARAVAAGSSGAAASNVLDSFIKFYEIALENGTKEDMSPEARLIVGRGMFAAEQTMVTALQELGVSEGRLLSILPPGKPGRKFEDKFTGPMTIDALMRAGATAEELEKINLFDPSQQGANFPFTMGTDLFRQAEALAAGAADSETPPSRERVDDTPIGGTATQGSARSREAAASLPIASQAQTGALFKPGQAPQTQGGTPTPQEATAQVETILGAVGGMNRAQRAQALSLVTQLFRSRLISAATLQQAKQVLSGK